MANKQQQWLTPLAPSEVEERRRVWGVILAATQLVAAAPLFRCCHPVCFDAFLGLAAVVVACMGGLTALPSPRASAAFVCLRLAADSALLSYLTVWDPQWSSSPWAIYLHVISVLLCFASLAFFRIPSSLAYASGSLVVASSLVALATTCATWASFRAADCAPLAVPLAQLLLLCIAADANGSAPRPVVDKGAACSLGASVGASVGAARRAITPAGCEVQLFNEDLFAEVRRRLGVQDDFVNDGWSFDDLSAGGGKGGTAMAFIGDAFIVKELSDGDHAVLLEITKSYCEHMGGGCSRLCMILMHFFEPTRGKKCFVMRNECGNVSTLKDLYDLKGCADDRTILKNRKPIKSVRKRIWNLHLWGGQCCWTPERVIYKEGKVAASRLQLWVTPAQRQETLAAIRRDTAWLQREGLMDYSLIVGVRNGPPGAYPNRLGRQTLVRSEADGTETLIDFGIIDFLQRWTTAKVVAQHIKFLETNKATVPPYPYASRFLVHFERVFRAVA